MASPPPPGRSPLALGLASWSLVAAVSILVLAWLAATLGAVVLTGALPAPVLALVPALAAVSPLSAGLALFAGGALTLAAAAYLGAVVVDARASARRA